MTAPLSHWLTVQKRERERQKEKERKALMPGSSPGWSRVFEAGTVSATYLNINYRYVT